MLNMQSMGAYHFNRRKLILTGSTLPLLSMAACRHHPGPVPDPCQNCSVINLPPLNALTRDTSSDFDWPQRMLGAAICAYNIPPDNSPFDPTYWNPIGVKGDAIAIADGEACIDGAFIAVTHDDWVVLSLRGTLGRITDYDGIKSFIDDWLEDAQSDLVPFDPNPPVIDCLNTRQPKRIPVPESFGNVHFGFQRAMQKLWLRIQPALDRPEIDLSGRKRIMITGHSKGAALTFLAALMVHFHYKEVEDIRVHAFAAPQTGDRTFAESYNKISRIKSTTRYQHSHDIVPFLPPYTDCIDPAENFDIFDHLEWGLKDLFLDLGLSLAGREITKGYARVGEVKFYGDNGCVLSGMTGELAARSQLEAIIRSGSGEGIAAAHSAVNSYWPALIKAGQSGLDGGITPLCRE